LTLGPIFTTLLFFDNLPETKLSKKAAIRLSSLSEEKKIDSSNLIFGQDNLELLPSKELHQQPTKFLIKKVIFKRPLAFKSFFCVETPK